jgi:cytochrome bd ubiquinol oxidase subunit I
MFRGQCLSCHTVEGYRAITRYLHGRDETAIANILNMLHQHHPETPYSKFMPPLVGTETERVALAGYLRTLVQPPGNPTIVPE